MDNLYYPLQILHSLNRWLVLFFLLHALVRLIKGVTTNAAWTAKDLRAVRLFALFMTIQFVLGVALWVIPSGLVQVNLSLQEFKMLVKNKGLRFFILEHPVQLTFALALSHMTSVMMKRAVSDKKKFILGLVFLSIVTIIMMISIPWPFFGNPEIARPWLRGLSRLWLRGL